MNILTLAQQVRNMEDLTRRQELALQRHDELFAQLTERVLVLERAEQDRKITMIGRGPTVNS